MQIVVKRSATGLVGVDLASSVKRAMEQLLDRIQLQEYEADLRAMGLSEEEVEGNRAFMDWEVKNENQRQ